MSAMLQVIASQTTWLLNAATSGGAAYMYEYSQLAMHNNTLQHNSGEPHELVNSTTIKCKVRQLERFAKLYFCLSCEREQKLQVTLWQQRIPD